MSVKRIDAVWEHSRQKENRLLAMIALADHADDNGYCWPGASTIAKKVRCHERTVPRLVEQLEREGEVYVERGGGRRAGGEGIPNRYIVLPGLSDRQIAHVLKKRFGKSALEIHAILVEIRERQAGKGVTVTGYTDEENPDTSAGTLTPAQEYPGTNAKNPDTAMSGEPSVEPSFLEPSVEPSYDRRAREVQDVDNFGDSGEGDLQLRLSADGHHEAGESPGDGTAPSPNPLPTDALLGELADWNTTLEYPFGEEALAAMAEAARTRHRFTLERLKQYLYDVEVRAHNPPGYVYDNLLHGTGQPPPPRLEVLPGRGRARDGPRDGHLDQAAERLREEARQTLASDDWMTHL